MSTNNWCHIKKPTSSTTFFNYGVQGIEHVDNYPPTVENPSVWKDGNGNFWMFGGQVFDESQYSGSVGRTAWVNT
ncbi:hypothetical protein ACC848_44305, partial [Rhizobium johnstonii]